MGKRLVLAPLVIAVTLAAVGEGKLEAAGATDPCALLSRQEAAELLGVAIERLAPNAQSGCDYFTAPVSQQARQQDIAKRFLDIARGGAEPKVADGDAAGVVRQTG